MGLLSCFPMLIIILKQFKNVYTIHLLFTTVRRCTITHTMHHISAVQCTKMWRPRQKLRVVNSLYHEKIMNVYTVRRQIHTVHRQRPCTKRVHERGRCAPKWRARQKWARYSNYTTFFYGVSTTVRREFTTVHRASSWHDFCICIFHAN